MTTAIDADRTGQQMTNGIPAIRFRRKGLFPDIAVFGMAL